MVVGAKANSKDGRIEGLPGVDPESGYKQKVVQWSFGAVSPPLVVEVSDPIPAPSGNGKVCYVVYTAESDVAPHFLNGRKGVYVRTDEFSARFEARLANDSELRHLLDRRKLILERRTALLARARRRFNTYAEARRQLPGGTSATSLPLLEICVLPRFPSKPVCEIENLAALITGNRLGWRQTGFPVSASSVISQQESSIVLGASGPTSMFEMNTWGTLYYGTPVANNDNIQVIYGIHLFGFVGYLLLFIRHAATVLRVLGYTGPIYIEVVLGSIRSIPWLRSSSPEGSAMRGSELDNDVTFSIDTTSEAIFLEPDKIATDILRYVLYSVNLPGLVDSLEKLKQLIRGGYEYNFWRIPPRLQT